MQTKFKRHQLVKILRSPDPEYVEYNNEGDPDFKEIPVKTGMLGRINILLPNLQYHVAILYPKGRIEEKILAYAPFSEDELEAIDK